MAPRTRNSLKGSGFGALRLTLNSTSIAARHFLRDACMLAWSPALSNSRTWPLFSGSSKSRTKPGKSNREGANTKTQETFPKGYFPLSAIEASTITPVEDCPAREIRAKQPPSTSRDPSEKYGDFARDHETIAEDHSKQLKIRRKSQRSQTK